MSVSVDVVSGEITVAPVTGEIDLVLTQTEVKVEVISAEIKVETAGSPGPPGPPGPPGVSNAAYTAQWRWTLKTTDATTAGQIGNNDETAQWAATKIFINQQKDDNTDVTAHLALISVGDRLRIQQKTDGTRWGDYEIAGAGIDRGTYWEFPVTVLEHSANEPGNNSETIVTHILDNPAGLDLATADDRYVNTAGDTMTGPLVLNADPVVPLGAAPRQYVDARTPKIWPPSPIEPVGAQDGDIWIDTN